MDLSADLMAEGLGWGEVLCLAVILTLVIGTALAARRLKQRGWYL